MKDHKKNTIVSTVMIGGGIAMLLFCHWPELTQWYCIYPDLTFQYIFNLFSSNRLMHPTDDISVFVFEHLLWLHAPAWVLLVQLCMAAIGNLKVVFVGMSFLQGIAALMILFWHYRRAESISKTCGGVFLMLAFLLTMDSLYGGMARGFGLLSTMLFFFAFLRRNMFLLCCALVGGLFCYIPSVVGMVLILGMVSIVEIRRFSLRERISGGVVAMLASLYIVWWHTHFSSIIYASTHMLDYKYIFPTPLVQSPYAFGGIGYGTGAVFQLYDIVVNCLLNGNEHGTEMYMMFMGCFIVCTMGGLIFSKEYRTRMKDGMIFIGVYCVIFILVSAKLPFVMASRVVVTAIPFALAYCGIEALVSMRPQRLSGGLIGGGILAFLLLCPHNNIRDYGNYAKILSYLQEHKTDTITGTVAGTLNMLEVIPFFTGWNVYFMNSWAIMPQTYEIRKKVQEREARLLFLLYGGDAGMRELPQFIKDNDIVYFVLDAAYMSRSYVHNEKDERLTGLFFPDVKRIMALYNQNSEFPLLEIARQYACYHDNEIYIVEAQAIENALKDNDTVNKDEKNG